MKTLSGLALLFIFVFIDTTVFAQRYGAIIDENGFNNSPKVTLPASGEKSGNTNIRLDLSDYAPLVQNQDKLNTCVAYAFVYNALGIEMGILNNKTNKEEITNMAFSPIYLFKKINKNRCYDPMDISQVAQYIENNGLLKFSELSTNACAAQITPEMDKRAAQNKVINKVQSLNFNSKDPWETKKRAIMEVLDRFNKPVIVGMYVIDTASFSRLRFPIESYQPTVANLKDYENVDTARQHAVTVVGYDKRREAFKILNSWGNKWGNEGYCWIPFDVFCRSTRTAYYLVLNETLSKTTIQNKTAFQGEFMFQYFHKNEVRVENPYHTKNGIYELNNKNWKVEQLFQLAIKNGNTGQAICVFSIDADNKVELHWPFSYGLGTRDQMPNKNIQMILPSEDTALEIQKAGTDNLIVLYSSKPIITQWDTIKARLEKSGNNPDIMARLADALGERLIAPSEINYHASGMAFSTNASKGDTVPIVLKIRSTN